MNYYDRNCNFQYHHLSDLCTSLQKKSPAQLHLPHGEGQLKLQRKAYINPQLVNFNVKQSISNDPLLKFHKIHFNPNFKRNEVNNLQKGNVQLVSSNMKLNEATNQSGSSNILKSTCDSYEKLATCQEKNICKNKIERDCDKIYFKSASRYKLINAKFNKQSKYSWSKKNTESINVLSNKNNLVKVNKQIGGVGNSFPKIEVNEVFSKKLSNSNLNNKLCEKKYLSKTKIINLNKTTLTNNIDAKEKLNLKHLKCYSSAKSNINYVYHKNKSLIRIASLVRNKYKYSRVKCLKISQYKIDKREKKMDDSTAKRNLTCYNDIRTLFPTHNYKVKSYHSNVSFNHSNITFLKSQLSHSWGKKYTPVKVTSTKKNTYPSKRLVKIGGILYKSTSNKLIISKDCKSKEFIEPGKKFIKKKKMKNHIVYVRGEKFLLDKFGKSLIRQSSDTDQIKGPSIVFKRIDIGGVTYLQNSQNVLIRTNMHQARQIVNQAKQKSIATLCHLRRKSALPCMIFYKFGKCVRNEKGLCIYKHDPKNIALCKKFLKGNCDKNNCLLSHEAIKEKMATCHFFLNGCCNRESCPFLHVKLNKNVEICKNFLQGFCNLGQNCTKRHSYQCPEFEKHGKCNLGTNCCYPHRIKKAINFDHEEENTKKENETLKYYTKTYELLSKTKQVRDKKLMLKQRESQNNRNGKKIKAKKRKCSQAMTIVDQTDQSQCIPKRVKLNENDLPAYIPLKSNS